MLAYIEGKRRARTAFTLIELLVVVTIIVLLIAILLPSLGRAKKVSQLTICQANMRGFYQGWALYAEEFNGVFLTGMDGGQPSRTNFIWRSNGSATSENNATIRMQGFPIYRYRTASIKSAYCAAATGTWTYETQRSIVDPPNWTQHGRSGYSIYGWPDWGNNSGAGSFSIFPASVTSNSSTGRYPGNLSSRRPVYLFEELRGRDDGKIKAVFSDYLTGSVATINNTHENRINVLYADGAINALPNDDQMKSLMALSLGGSTQASWDNTFTIWNAFTSRY